MKEIENRLQEIGNDNVSGARELADQAAKLLFDLLRSQKKISQEKLLQTVSGVCNRLFEMQPSIAPLYNLNNGLLLLLETKNPDFHLVEGGKEWLALFRRRLVKNIEDLRRRAVDLLPDRGTVLSYSYSSTVVEALIAGKKIGKSLRVICSEARPNLEGRRFARELADAGIPVRFVVDSALFGWVEEADIVLTGGDALSRLGLLNKVGTAALVSYARTRGKNRTGKDSIRIYALADSEKLIPTGLIQRLRVTSRDAGEVWDSGQRSIEVLNRYFDLTPLDWLDGVATESGLEDPKKLLERADALPVARCLAPASKKGESPKKEYSLTP